MSEFFQMGGYAFYVWTSYAVVTVLFLYHYISPNVRQRTLRKLLRDQR